ncbi:hypothetical protein BDV59DRAFT_187053 [Aspergillus ambiguus]|uniref:uncharacterized protein n=1 Tax=Aspergillus ambiguus TaxID=176160 RepID=UPI003CCD70C3
MFCISFLASCLVSSKGKATTPSQPTNTNEAGYYAVQPMNQVPHQNNQMLLDVVEAETRFGISFFRDYRGLLIRDRMTFFLFSACFRQDPNKVHLISCPIYIHAPDLGDSDRQLLELNLEAARAWIPSSHWRYLNVNPSNALRVFK